MFALTNHTSTLQTHSSTLSLSIAPWPLLFAFIFSSHSPKHNNFWSMKFVNGKLLAIITSSLKFWWISASKLIFLHVCVCVGLCLPSPTMCFYLLRITRYWLATKEGKILDVLCSVYPSVSRIRTKKNPIMPSTNVVQNERGGKKKKYMPEQFHQH